MIRTELIYDRAALIDNSLNRLEEFARQSLTEFLIHPDNYAIAEHHLRICLEALFDMGRHILVKTGFGKPSDYREILIMLSRQSVIPADFLENVKVMAGYRNRLVHMYNEIGGAEMYEIISHGLSDIRKFCAYIMKYVNDTTS